MRCLVVAAFVLLVVVPAASAGYRERDVREAAEAAGFGGIGERLAAASRPTVLVDRKRLPRAPRALGTSRLGGAPDLPAGRPWPQCGGRPQTFLGQVRLRDLPRTARPLRRHGGLLLFFTDVEFEDPAITSYGLSAGRCNTVVHAAAGASLTRSERPVRTLRMRAARMRFSAMPDVPDVSWDELTIAAPLRDVRIEDDRLMPYFDLREGLRGGPGDPAHRLLGYIDSPNGESGRCWARTRKRAAAWRHLFTMGWDEDLGFEIADAGRLQLAIAPADLRRGRFGRVCAIFDSA